jgi:hypothetical protein
MLAVAHIRITCKLQPFASHAFHQVSRAGFTLELLPAHAGYGTTLLDVLVRDYYMYFINDDMQTQSDATAACKSLAGDLVSIHNSEENAAVLQFGSKFLDRVPMFFGEHSAALCAALA